MKYILLLVVLLDIYIELFFFLQSVEIVDILILCSVYRKTVKVVRIIKSTRHTRWLKLRQHNRVMVCGGGIVRLGNERGWRGRETDTHRERVVFLEGNKRTSVHYLQQSFVPIPKASLKMISNFWKIKKWL